MTKVTPHPHGDDTKPHYEVDHTHDTKPMGDSKLCRPARCPFASTALRAQGRAVQQASLDVYVPSVRWLGALPGEQHRQLIDDTWARGCREASSTLAYNSHG